MLHRRRSPLHSVTGGALAGVLLTLATSPLPGLGVLGFVATAPLVHVALTGRARDAARAGFVCGIVFFGAGFLWVPWNAGGLFWLVWLAGVPVLAAPMAGLGVAVAAARRRFGTGAACSLVPALWAALEAARALEPCGIGWLRLGHALAPWPAAIQLASVGGVGLVSAWAASIGATLACAVATRSRAPLAVSLVLCAGGLAWGAARLATELPASTPLRVAAIQPAVPASERFVPAHFQANLARLFDLSDAALAGSPDLVVWPEGAFEQGVGVAGAPFLGSVANTLGVPVLAGARRPAPDDPRERWNSALLATPDGDTRTLADKQRPLPIQERAPVARPAGALAALASLPGRVRAGAPAEPSAVVTPSGAVRRVGALICVDDAFPEIARGLRLRGAELLVTIANEAEAGRWAARQHALLVRLRAVETALPVVRVANEGPSVWIDAQGREIARMEPGRASATAAVGAAGAPTVHTQIGDASVLAALFLPFSACVAAAERDRLARRRRPVAGVLAP